MSKPPVWRYTAGIACHVTCRVDERDTGELTSIVHVSDAAAAAAAADADVDGNDR